MKVQVKKEHYDFNKYTSINRWSSYYYQISEVTKLNDIHTILLIGVGDGVVNSTLSNMGYDVTTFDFDERLNSDIVGSVTDIEKILDKKYDCIICCQVLEHLPYEMLDNIMSQFSRIANKNVIISLPYNSVKIFTSKIFIPFIHNISIKLLMPKFWQLKYRIEKEGWGEHYYQIGIKNVKKKDIRKTFKKHFILKKEFNPIENTYHIFYILEVKK